MRRTIVKSLTQTNDVKRKKQRRCGSTSTNIKTSSEEDKVLPSYDGQGQKPPTDNNGSDDELSSGFSMSDGINSDTLPEDFDVEWIMNGSGGYNIHASASALCYLKIIGVQNCQSYNDNNGHPVSSVMAEIGQGAKEVEVLSPVDGSDKMSNQGTASSPCASMVFLKPPPPLIPFNLEVDPMLVLPPVRMVYGKNPHYTYNDILNDRGLVQNDIDLNGNVDQNFVIKKCSPEDDFWAELAALNEETK